jgi:hypothetical protein
MIFSYHAFLANSLASDTTLWTHSYIAFCADISSTVPSDVFLLDKDFKCIKERKRGLTFHGRVAIENGSRRIELKGERRTLNEFIESITLLRKSSPWVKRHRHDSYAPIRTNAKMKWYVDGKDYFFAVSEAISAAKTEIYIEDWWLSPELVSTRKSRNQNSGTRRRIESRFCL